MYAWINGKFNRDARLARPQILAEISNCKIGNERNALRIFMAKWDAAVERLIQTGVTHNDDLEILYVNFKPSFMNCPDLSEHAAKVRRSLPSSKVHSYKWMYRAAKARLETLRLEEQEAERFAATLPGAAHPLTPATEKGKGGKGKAKGKGNGTFPAVPQRNSNLEACQDSLEEQNASLEINAGTRTTKRQLPQPKQTLRLKPKPHQPRRRLRRKSRLLKRSHCASSTS